MAKTPPPRDLRVLARRRLDRLNEPDPEELKREVEEARKQGYKLVAAPGVRIFIRDYSVKPGDEE